MIVIINVLIIMIVIINVLIIMYNSYFINIEINNISNSITNLINNAINFVHINSIINKY